MSCCIWGYTLSHFGLSTFVTLSNSYYILGFSDFFTFGVVVTFLVIFSNQDLISLISNLVLFMQNFFSALSTSEKL